MPLNSPSISFIGFQRLNTACTGIANTVISEALNIKEKLGLQANDFAVLLRGHSILYVLGANAAGANNFKIFIGQTLAASYCNLWWETIAAAALLENSTHEREIPYSSDSAKGSNHPVYLKADENIYFYATAGGALCQYVLGLYTLWAIFRYTPPKTLAPGR